VAADRCAFVCRNHSANHGSAVAGGRESPETFTVPLPVRRHCSVMSLFGDVTPQ